MIVGISLPDDDPGGIGISGGHTVVIKEYDENNDAYKLMGSGDETAAAVPRNRQTVLQQMILHLADNIDMDGTGDGPMLDATDLVKSYGYFSRWLLDDDAYSLEFKYTKE